jgi:diguanylate cyclase (GGDEF)-like protein
MPGRRRPTKTAVTVGRAEPAGATLAPGHKHAQSRLLAELIAFMTRDTPSVEHLLDLLDRHLRDSAGLTALTVCTLEPDDGRLLPVACLGDPRADDPVLAGRVFRTPAGAPPLTDGDRTAVRLRAGGQTVGVLVLTGHDLGTLRPATVDTVALHLAGTLQSLVAERQRQFVSHSTAILRRLFEEGTVATSVEAAGELLARATVDAFRIERAGLYLTDADGRIRHTIGVGVTAERSEFLSRALEGRFGADSPVWRATMAAGGPILVDDADLSPARPGGLVQAMELRAYVAMPLLSASGPVGLVICGDAGGTRVWHARDRVLARQLAVEGALIVDSARLRQAEHAHLAELTRQAFHDALTGLPNRSHLLERAEQAVEIAGATGGRAALLLIDLDGFKAVNDSAGHHAGDALLCAVAQRLLGAVRDGDLVARLGGDEFAVLLAGDPDERLAREIAGRINERLGETFRIEDRDITIGGSVGGALFPDHASDVHTLIRRADALMYQAKRAGGGIQVAH